MPAEAPYELLAGEYYEDRHVTSRNFDSTTIAALHALDLTLPDGLVLEVGCGRGRSQEFLGVTADRVVQLDNSAAMLDLQPRESCALRVLHDAEQLPFPPGEFAIVAAFLCDPFLGLNFLGEASRVLRPGGKLIGTAPTYEWGSSLRQTLNLDPMVTRFVLSDGRTVQMPSAIYKRDQLVKMLIRTGFARASLDVQAHYLPPGTSPVSSDISEPARSLGVSALDLPVIYTIVAVS